LMYIAFPMSRAKADKDYMAKRAAAQKK